MQPPAAAVDVRGLRLWHKLDDVFRVPRTSANFALAAPASYANPRAAAVSSLALRLMHDALNETTYLADVAGLQYDVWHEGRGGIEVKVDGFSHKLPLLVQTVFQSLADFKVEAGDFERVKEALVRKLTNANMHVDRHGTYTRLRALKHLWDVHDVLKELETLEAAEVQTMFRDFLASIHIECLIEGNMTSAEAKGLVETVRGAFCGRSLLITERPGDQVAHIREGSSFLIRQQAKNGEEDNSAVEAYFQAGVDVLALRARLDLLEQIASEPCFNRLRTKEQLGYTVTCGVRLTHNVLGFAVVVLSGSHAPSHLDARIEAFLASLRGDIDSMPEDEFERNREALIAAKQQKDRSLQDHADRHWEQITSRRYRFNAREEEVEALRKLSKADVLDCYSRYLEPGSGARAKLAVHILGRQHRSEVERAAPEGVKLAADPEKLRQSLDLYPSIDGLPLILGEAL